MGLISILPPTVLYRAGPGRVGGVLWVYVTFQRTTFLVLFRSGGKNWDISNRVPRDSKLSKARPFFGNRVFQRKPILRRVSV